MKIKMVAANGVHVFQNDCSKAASEGYVPITGIYLNNDSIGAPTFVQQWALFETKEDREVFKETRMIAI